MSIIFCNVANKFVPAGLPSKRLNQAVLNFSSGLIHSVTSEVYIML